jgi:hypothetical protein
MEVLCIILIYGERGRLPPWLRPAKHFLPGLFSAPFATLRETIPPERCGQIAPPRFARASPEARHAPVHFVHAVHECPFLSVKPMPLGKPAEKSTQTIYNKLLTNCSRSNQVNPSQSESNQLHRLDQPPIVQVNRTASQSVAVINLSEGHAETGFSLRLCASCAFSRPRYWCPKISASRQGSNAQSQTRPELPDQFVLNRAKKIHTNPRHYKTYDSSINSSRASDSSTSPTPCPLSSEAQW